MTENRCYCYYSTDELVDAFSHDDSTFFLIGFDDLEAAAREHARLNQLRLFPTDLHSVED